MANIRVLRTRLEQALGAGDIERAAGHAAALLTAGQADPLVLNLAAWRKEEAGDFAGAYALLQRALALSPGDVLILGSIGAVLRKQGLLDEALALLDRVVASEPRHAAAWLERGYVLDELRSDAKATESYLRALAIDPGLAPALGKLADAAARRGDAEASAGYAARALALNPAEPAAVFAEAFLAIEAKDGARGAALLEALLATRLTPEDRTRTLTLLGDAYDKQDRTADAFATYSRAQANFRDAYRAFLEPGPDRPSHRSFIETILRQVEQTGAVAALPTVTPVAGEAAAHVFLLGYPRSGTTLIENVLASAPGVVALEERDTLTEIDAALLANDGTMPPLDSLDPALVARLRAAYWARVRTLGGDVAGKTLVDMNPFNGIKLPILARLFPEARIVIMRRDPRDVVLSCFRVNFTPGAGAWAFSDLEETARHYDTLMRLIDCCRGNLPLACHEVRYDRLVADFKPTVAALAAFIGLEWTDDFAAFDKTAKARGVRTASATQVRKGLYNGGGQWRRYAAELAPVLPILAPWIARFGTPD
ncbi:tetratricopeptide repeat-containing sulfotransferase family protein [Sphingomonas immobilis]|uniref:Sulfotransferase n=1 Tax=Sphingomonas immobilis TaxID=3063997 RepID=A0ABT8ZVH1_9SPHN|nr:tetratricopeptide repeat-containing sulfotransferase family protein [Sphingomonas sp. CA1-15]MDO7841575.1 sulfotransferase [Sphingomonas sp. CA1-15]